MGNVLLIVSSAAMGIKKSRELTIREHSLEEILQMLLLLKGEIRFGGVTLRDACLDASERMSGCCGRYLKSVGELLSGTEPEKAFLLSGRAELAETGLSEDELSPLYALGKRLGYLDTQMQVRQLELCEEEFRRTLSRLRADLPEKQKMYRSLGMLGGFLLAALLW